MTFIKLLPRLGIAMVACVIVSGCVVVNYDAPPSAKFDLTEKTKHQYRIASAECITIDTPSQGKYELKLLSAALNNQPGNDFGEYWRKSIVELKKNPGNFELDSSSVSAWRLNTRSIAPTLFELNDGIPVNVRAVMFIRPERINPWWTIGYLLSASILSPMQSRSFGAASVAILDQNGKTLDAKTIIFHRTSWFSTLFPLALFGAGNFSVKAAGTSPELDEKNLQIQIMSSMVAKMLRGVPVKASRNWRNIRAAAVEAVACDNSDAALKLIKAASMQKLGGKECKEFLEILD
jgi:hypothetical protein